MTRTPPSQDLLERHGVAVDGDRPWQRRLRLLQSLWRKEMGLAPGVHGDGMLGSRLLMPAAKDDLSNYLTSTIKKVVRAELGLESTRSDEKMYSEPRIYDDLLSSQPLCFNLFGELKDDLGAATAWAAFLWPERVARVTRFEFEHSPGRRDPRYLGNRTAFDVYLEHTVPGGGEGFIGIEVKYHESLQVKPAETRERVFEVARASKLFSEASIDFLKAPPLQQIWFDHLLAQSMLQADEERWGTNGLYVLLHPVANEACYRVASAYQRHLLDLRSFQRLTLEEAVAALRLTSGQPWVEAFHRRYLDYDRA